MDAFPLEVRKKLSGWIRAEVKAGRLPREFGDMKNARRMADQCLDHFAATGNPRGYCDWPAVIRNWFRRAVDFERHRVQDQREQYRHEHPQETRELGDGELRLVFGGKR